MDLTKLERLMLINQCRILEKLYPEESKGLTVRRKALEDGYRMHYGALAEYLSPDMSEEDCREVIHILDMYRAISDALRSGVTEDISKDPLAHFVGFDGNEECSLYAYTEYLVVDQERFEELRPNGEYPGYNSHAPMLAVYRRMLKAWRQCGDARHLSAADLRRIFEAGRRY